MKTLLTLSALLLTCTTFAQVQKVDSTKRKSFRSEKVIRFESKPVRMTETISDVFGDFTVEKYSILSTTTPCARDLNALLGTLIRIQNSTVTGDEIDPLSFEMFDIEHMSSSDYIYRVFDRQVKAPEPELPPKVKVHKTDNAACYGIIDLGSGRVAVPYKGVLLFLTKK